MFDVNFPYTVEPMRWGDVPAVMAIERESFSMPWPERAYRYELAQNKRSHYIVVRTRPAPAAQGGWERLKRLLRRGSRAPVLAFGGFWLDVGQAHISTLAVARAWRGRSLGELVLWSMLKQAVLMGAFEAVLEVRVSNHAAQNLYLKYGFKKTGQQRQYYRDNGEDAWVMTLADLNASRAQLGQLGQELQRKLWQKVAQAASGQSAVVGL
jgi:ribosomal-protein-alanine N-acetyltransferase